MFWTQAGPLHDSIFSRLLRDFAKILEDLGVDAEIDDPLLFCVDSEAVDRMGLATLNGIGTRPVRIRGCEPWFPSFVHLIQLLRRPSAEALLPGSWRIAIALEISQIFPSLTVPKSADIFIAKNNSHSNVEHGNYAAEFIRAGSVPRSRRKDGYFYAEEALTDDNSQYPSSDPINDASRQWIAHGSDTAPSRDFSRVALGRWFLRLFTQPNQRLDPPLSDGRPDDSATIPEHSSHDSTARATSVYDNVSMEPTILSSACSTDSPLHAFGSRSSNAFTETNSQTSFEDTGDADTTSSTSNLELSDPTSTVLSLQDAFLENSQPRPSDDWSSLSSVRDFLCHKI
ncbi:hypothetical protein C8R43DRAFT_506366 [Mycena crocata]|nr:hypothetical protein C8R43DRAFT_506366 [Mycena crocata]